MAPIVHGHKTGTYISPTYRIWLGIKRRCSDPNCKDYKNYGQRGIIVCPRWNKSFVNFLTDMGPRPGKLTIDRLNPNKGYSKANCRWIEHRRQTAENKRNLISVTVDGQTFHSVSAAARHFGVTKSAAFMRIEAGIPIETAVSQPERLKSRRSKLSYLPKKHPRRQS